jgi:hypothetical protein
MLKKSNISFSHPFVESRTKMMMEVVVVAMMIMRHECEKGWSEGINWRGRRKE